MPASAVSLGPTLKVKATFSRSWLCRNLTCLSYRAVWFFAFNAIFVNVSSYIDQLVLVLDCPSQIVKMTVVFGLIRKLPVRERRRLYEGIMISRLCWHAVL